MPLIKQNSWLILSLIQSLGFYRLAQLYKKQKKQYNKLCGLTVYLVDMLEKNDIGLTEFDAIALQNLGVRITRIKEY